MQLKDTKLKKQLRKFPKINNFLQLLTGTLNLNFSLRLVYIIFIYLILIIIIII